VLERDETKGAGVVEIRVFVVVLCYERDHLLGLIGWRDPREREDERRSTV